MVTNEELAVAYQHGDSEALSALWAQVEKLAVHFVKRYRSLAESNKAAEFEDLMQAAFLGVERAASAYREDEGRFSTIMDYYVKTEVYGLLGLRGRMRREHYDSVSTNTPIGEEGTATVGDMIEDEGLPDADEELHRDDVRREVHEAIGRLPNKQATAVWRFYIDGHPEPDGIQDRRNGVNKLRRDRRLKELAEDTLCYRHKSVAAFNRDWTSSTEAAALWRMNRR